jgi:hypothetical protein
MGKKIEVDSPVAAAPRRARPPSLRQAQADKKTIGLPLGGLRQAQADRYKRRLTVSYHPLAK